MKLTLLIPTLIALTALSGCGSLSQQPSEKAEDPNVQVDQALARYEATLASGSACQTASKGWSDPVDCEGLLREVLQLYAAYPNNERVSLLAALMTYQAGRAEQAGYLLDQLLKGHKPRPEAAILRSRIAMEEGNLNLARTLLLQQIRLNPRHPQLHETLAAVHYLARNHAAAFNALALAERLGAPAWQVAYHRGLVFEQQQQRDAACQQYTLALSANRQFTAPQSRLVGMTDSPACLKFKGLIGG